MKYVITHGRDPDSDCEVQLLVIDDEGNITTPVVGVFDVDPGRGYTREDWDETTRYDVETARKFGGDALAERIQQMRDGYGDSEFVT